MKLKFWQGEFEFDRDDAVIVIPIILLLLSFGTPLPKVWLLIGFAAYYAVLFFGGKLVQPFKKMYYKWVYRCPYCESHHTIMLGWMNYLGDIPYHWYKCNDCGEDSVELDGKLVKPGNWKLTSGKM